VVRALVLAAVLALLVAGIAAALGFRLPGLELRRVETLPPAGVGLDLGSPVPIGDVIARGDPPLLLPPDRPRPDVAYEIGAGDRRIVTLAWRAAPGERALAGSDLALSLLAVRGSTEDELVTKLLGPGTRVDRVRVGADDAWWISGAPHELLLKRDDGTIGNVEVALAGDTLVWSHEGTLYRLESALGRDATLAVANALVPAASR